MDGFSSRRFTAAILGLCAFIQQSAADEKEAEKVFSGPQVGEKLPPLKVRGVFGDAAGKELELVREGDDKPRLLLFVHELNRPCLATVRAVMNYAAPRAKEGKLVTAMVMLTDDATAAEELLKRAKGALPQGVPITISPDGAEGPGGYGLNRKVTLTVLVAKENKVTANFALVQPSLQADAPKIAAAVADALGVKRPSAKELGAEDAKPARSKAKGGEGQDPNVGPLLRAVIRKDATKEEVDAAARKVIEYIDKNREAAKQVGQVAKRIIDSGKLADYGTPHAQEYIQAWAKKYGEKE